MNDLDNTKINASLFIIIMILAGIFGLIATDIYAPSLPLVPQLFATSATLAQLTVSVFLMGFAITQFVAGMLSDNYGRKPVLIIGLIIFILGTVFCIFADSILVLILGRIIQGVGAGAIAVLSRILLRDKFSGLKMAQIGSYIAAFIGLSPAVAPVIGGFIQQRFGFTAIFIFLLSFAVLLFYLTVFHLPETNRFRHLHQLSINTIFDKYKQVLSNKVFWANVIATGCGLAVIIACAVINPFLLQNTLKISPTVYGLLAFGAMSGMFIGMIFNGYMVAKVGVRNMILTGKLLIFLGGISFITFSLVSTLSILNVIFPTFIITLAAAFILPNAVVCAFTPFPEIAGTVGAVYGCLQICITAIVSAFISAFNEPSQLLLGIVIGGLMIISVGSYYILNFYNSYSQQPS